MSSVLDQLEAHQRLLDLYRDHSRFCADLLTIEPEIGPPVPLVERPAQRLLTEAITRQERARKPVRVIVLKSRRVNVSVGASTHIWRRVKFRPGFSAAVITHLADTTTQMFRYYMQWERRWQELEDQGIAPWSGAKAKRNVHGESIEYDNGNRIDFFTAGNKAIGRGQGYQGLHASEGPFWAGGGRDVRRGLFNSIPQLPGTLIIDEGTANGAGGAFYDSWMRAGDEGDYERVFFPWHRHPLYVQQVADPEKLQASLSPEEHAMRTNYGLTLEQLAWRRAKIGSTDGDPRTFQQEYPSCWEEAFLTSGRPRFDLLAIERMPTTEMVSGELNRRKVGPDSRLVFTPRPDGFGILRVARPPQAGRTYSIGVDSAQGKDANEKSAGSPDADYSCAQVVDSDTGEQVAVMRARCEPGEFARHLMALAEWYDWAFTTVEANTQGFGVVMLQCLLHEGFPLHKLYARDRSPDDRTATPLHKLGFLTASNNRELLLSGLAMALIDGEVTVYDPVTRQELRQFVWINGKAQAQVGAHDDTVIALALALAGRTQAIQLREAEQRYKSRRPGNQPLFYTDLPGRSGPKDDDDDDD